MKGDIIGYRFGGTEEAYLMPVREAADPVEAQRQHNWVKTHPQAIDWALQCGKCAWYDHPDGRKILTEVHQPTFCQMKVIE